MFRSHIIEAQGVFVGVAVTEGPGYRVVATHPRTVSVHGTTWPTFDAARRAAAAAFRNAAGARLSARALGDSEPQR